MPCQTRTPSGPSSPPPATTRRNDRRPSVRAEALSVLDVETLRVRKAGLEYLVDIHIEVDPDLTVREGHAIAHRVKDRLIGRIGPVRDVLVHVEPAEDA